MIQFGLKTLLLLTLLAAVACAVVFVLPSWVGFVAFLTATLVLAAPLAGGAAYWGGNARAFAIGGLAGYAAWAIALGNAAGFDFPSGITAFEEHPTLASALLASDLGMSIIYFALCWPTVLVGGLAGWLVRRMGPSTPEGK
jgi:hypothetical protein